MFVKPLIDNKVTPNFLNSILTNSSLYMMFKNNFDENSEYFKSIPKSEYLYEMLLFISNKLSSNNLLQIYENINKDTSVQIGYIKRFFDDFLLDQFINKKESIFETSFFKALEYCYNHDLYAKKDKNFIKFYKYVLAKTEYDKKSKEISSYLEEKLKDGKLSISDFELLCNYVKNNKNGYISMSMVGNMLKLHAYKQNHIFDRDVVKVIIYSTARDYLLDIQIPISIEYIEEINLDELTYEINPPKIYIQSILIDTFITGNYIEIFSDLFYKLDLYRNRYLLTNNIISIETLGIIMSLINFKVDLEKLYVDDAYIPYSYISDLKASSFVKSLKFYKSFDIDLFMNYINSQTIDIDMDLEPVSHNKEISYEIQFMRVFIKLDQTKREIYLKKYSVLDLFYYNNGTRKSAIDLLKAYSKTKDNIIVQYLISSIPLPEYIINDAIDLSSYNSTNQDVIDLKERLLKYILIDAFYYSLNGFLMLNTGKKTFDKISFLNELYIKVSSIKINKNIEKFVNEVLSIIEIEQQNN